METCTAFSGGSDAGYGPGGDSCGAKVFAHFKGAEGHFDGSRAQAGAFVLVERGRSFPLTCTLVLAQEGPWLWIASAVVDTSLQSGLSRQKEVEEGQLLQSSRGVFCHVLPRLRVVVRAPLRPLRPGGTFEDRAGPNSPAAFSLLCVGAVERETVTH